MNEHVDAVLATAPEGAAPAAPGEVKNPLLVALGERVRNLRAQRGLTRKAVAIAAEVSERHLANLEYGIGNASILVLQQVAGALHCSLAELVGDVTTSSPEWLLIRELLDLAAQLDEGHLEVVGQHLAQRGLARAPQPDQRHTLSAVGTLCARPHAEQLGQGLAGTLQVGFRAAAEQLADQQPIRRFRGDVADQFGQRAIESAGDLQQHQDRGVAHPVLQIGQMPFGHTGYLRQALARHAAYGSQAAHPLAQCHQESFPPGFGWRRV